MVDDPFSMVVAIVLIVSVAGVLRAKYARRGRDEAAGDSPEAARLRDELKALKERVAVLERIATDGSAKLDREIEALRDRN
jgi:hypothetical protein